MEKINLEKEALRIRLIRCLDAADLLEECEFFTVAQLEDLKSAIRLRDLEKE